MNILGLWHDWSGPIEWGFAMASGWAAKAGRYRLQSQSNRLSAGEQALKLVAASQEREMALTVSYERLVALEATARAHAVATADVLQTVYEQAIGARLKVHDLEAKAGITLTVFTPLPPFPAQEAPQSDALDVNNEALKAV
ncbi:hypothetical protein Gbfr_042_053 [Gluconobacter frateurii M-2]|nr:hypothetical protein Gbfr_042_053 [Gluconobacter frateurii M-2]